MKGRWGVAVIVAVATALGGASPALGASGSFEVTWGKDVLSNGAPSGFEVCLAAASCKIGLATGELGGEFSGPDAVAVDSPNSFTYVADTNHDRIQKFNLAGGFFRTWGKDVVNGSGTGNLEVCTSAAGCQAAAASTGLGGEMDTPEGVAVDDNGDVYVSERFGNRIEKFSANGGFIAAWGKDVIKPGGSGDTGTGYEICTVQADCKAAAVSTGKGGELNSPNGIASDGTFIYVADRVNNRIQKFTQAGAFVRAWGKDVVTGGPTGAEACTLAASCKAGAASTGLGGELNTPVGLAADGAGNVYVADTNGSEVQKFSDLGAWERTWGKDVVAGGGTGAETCTVASSCQAGDNSGDLGGEFNQPTGIAANSSSVIVSDTYNERIQQFDPTGRFFVTWGSHGSLGGQMQLPGGLALGADSRLYLADGSDNRVQRFGTEPPVFPPPPAGSPPTGTPVKKKCKRKKHHRSAESAKKCKKKRKK